jgi:hypothetical protein
MEDPPRWAIPGNGHDPLAAAAIIAKVAIGRGRRRFLILPPTRAPAAALICWADERASLGTQTTAGLEVELSVRDERMFESDFSFMKSSPASSQSICASIAAANCGIDLCPIIPTKLR